MSEDTRNALREYRRRFILALVASGLAAWLVWAGLTGHAAVAAVMAGGTLWTILLIVIDRD